MGYGAAVTDFDADGHFEIFVTSFGGANRILKWMGGGLVDVAPAFLEDIGRQAIGVAAADLTSNGREEIYLLNSDTFAGRKRFADRLYRFGNNGWEDLFRLPETQDLANMIAGRSVAALDRSGSGRYGFFTANYGAPMRLYEIDPSGNLIDGAPEAGLSYTAGGRSLLALQLITHRMDLFVGNEAGPNFLFANNGDGTFTELAQALGLSDPTQHARGVVALDVNSDGLFDIACGNWEGPHRLFIQTTNGDFLDQASTAWSRPSRVRTVIAADFDNDGREEIFFNNIGQPNRLYRNWDGRIEEIDPGEAVEAMELGTGAVTGDFDNDGQLELLIVHGESGFQPLSLFKAESNSGNWLRVLPLTQYGAPARGGMVTLIEKDRVQRRSIDAGSGYLCQMEPVAHFGLGDVPQVERIIIRWPGGEMKMIESPECNTLHNIKHPISEKPGLYSE